MNARGGGPPIKDVWITNVYLNVIYRMYTALAAIFIAAVDVDGAASAPVGKCVIKSYIGQRQSCHSRGELSQDAIRL